MRSSILLASAGAMLAMASPVKRAYQTTTVWDLVTVTVYAGEEPTSTAAPDVVKPTSVVAPPPVKTTAVAAPVVPTTHYVPPPAPKTTYVAPPVQYVTTVVEAPVQPSPTQASSGSSSGGSSSGSSSSGDSSNLSSYQQVVIDQHNLHRANHSSPDLTWDSTLADYATITANKCVFAHDMHEGNGGYGQNLASWGSSGDISGLQNQCVAQGISDQWYQEINNWHYWGQSNPPSGLDIDDYGHFTQMVWKNSLTVGCATVQCAAGTVLDYPSWFTVCNYGPEGNIGGEYGDNVLAPNGDAPEYVTQGEFAS